MDKKQYTLQILHKIEPYRNIATWLIAMIELWDCSNDDIDQIINIIEKNIESISQWDLKEKLEKVKNILLMIKQKEAIMRKNEAIYIEKLIQQINRL